jgi:hypothetical protein
VKSLAKSRSSVRTMTKSRGKILFRLMPHLLFQWAAQGVKVTQPLVHRIWCSD